MLLLFQFWPANAPVAPPPPGPPPPPPPPGAGASLRLNRNIPATPGVLPVGAGKSAKYEPLTPEQWDVREAYLRSLYPADPPPPPGPDLSTEYERQANAAYQARKEKLEELNAQRATEINELRHAGSLGEIKAHGAKIEALNNEIHDLMGKQAVSRFMH